MGIHITVTRKTSEEIPRWRRVTRRGVLFGAVVLSLFLVGGGVALANIPDAGTGVFHGCVNASTGALRVIDPSKGQTCNGAETAVSWNQQGITWRGGWSATTAYVRGDAVRYVGSSYVAKKPSTNVVPGTTSTATWSLMASEGAQGPAGTDGKTVLNGSGPPSLFTGTAGDFYIDTVHHVIYGPATVSCLRLRCEIHWGSGASLVGPAGQGTVYETKAGFVNLPSGASERVVTQTIPVTGDYSVTATVDVQHQHLDSGALFFCSLVAANPGGNIVTLDQDVPTSVPGVSAVNVPLQGIVSLAAGGIIGINCDETLQQRDDDIYQSHILTTQVSGFQIVPPG